MRAAVLTGDHAFRVESVPDPAPAPRELVLRVRACGICGSDLKSYSLMPPGAVLGHEFCGEVVAVGSAVAPAWREGQAVAAMPLAACGTCRWCMSDLPAHCERVDLLGLGGTPGAFAEYVRVDAGSAVPLDESLGDAGALVEPLAVGLHAAAAAEIRPGDTVLILGGGSVGASVAVWARRLGAAEVIVSDPVAARREGAARFGATGVHDPSAGPPRSCDVVIECVGAPGMLQAALDAVVTRGRLVVAGVCMVPDAVVPVTAIMKEVQVRFAVYYRRNEFAAAAALLASGGVDPAAFVGGAVGLDRVGTAFERMLSLTTERKILVTPHA